MVIHQFNKVISNKWLWGAIAVLFCLMFVGSDLVSTFVGDRGRRPRADDAGTLGGEPVSADEFMAFADDVRGHGNSRDVSTEQNKINEIAWRNLAAYRTAEKNGVIVSDRLLSQAIQGMFGMRNGFDFDRYRMFVASQYGLTPEAFEASYRRNLVVGSALPAALLRSAAWASPMETDQIVADRTDAFTVSVARFEQDKAEADAITLDDAGLRAWYEKNIDSLALPELVRIRYVRYSASDESVLARMVVTEDDMHDQYDANVDRYTSTDTNGVDVVKSFDEVKGEIEKELRKIEALNYFETNLTRRAYANVSDSEKGKSRLEAIAAEDGAAVGTSGWFALDGTFKENFTVRASSVLPGAKAFVETVSELDPEVDDLRYAVVSSDDCVWLVEKSDVAPARTPSFEESRDKIAARALADARADAFKAKVEAVAANGVEAVLSSGNVTNGVKFVISDVSGNQFPDQSAVLDAAAKLRKGEISEFVQTGVGRGLLVYCEDRTVGDAASITVSRVGARDQAAAAMLSEVSGKWPQWNLERLGFTTTSASSVLQETDETDETGTTAPAAEESPSETTAETGAE